MASYQKYHTKHGYLWRYQISQNGKRIGQRGFKSKAEARVSAQRAEEKMQKGIIDTNQTFDDIYQLWFESYKLTVKESTWVTTKRIFNDHILPIFADKKISSINTVFCQLAVNSWFKHPYAQYKRYFNYTSKVLRYAVRLKIIASNPADAVIVPQARHQKINKRNPKQEYYTKHELQHFLECAYDFDNYQAYAFFRLLAFSGIRKGEALALSWNDIDFKLEKIKITKTQSNGNNRLVVQTTKTENSDREVYVDSKTLAILRHWKQEQRIELFAFGFNSDEHNQLVFASRKNEMHNPNKARVWLRQICKRYDLKPIPIHGFRHTYATLAIEGGIQPKQLQEQLGHSDIKTTLDIYTSVTKGQKQDTAQQFVKFVNF